MKLLVISSMFLCLKQRKRNHYHAGPQSPLSSRMLSGCAMFGDDDCKLPMLKVASNESFYFLFYFLLKSFYWYLGTYKIKSRSMLLKLFFYFFPNMYKTKLSLHLYVCVCLCVWSTRFLFFILSFFFFLKPRSLTGLEFIKQANCLAGKPQGFSCLLLPAQGMRTALFFCIFVIESSIFFSQYILIMILLCPVRSS